MRLRYTKDAIKQFDRLPKNLKRKAQKQFIFLLENYRHPSLRSDAINPFSHVTTLEAVLPAHISSITL